MEHAQTKKQMLTQLIEEAMPRLRVMCIKEIEKAHADGVPAVISERSGEITTLHPDGTKETRKL